MTEARPDTAASASLWERDAELAAITDAIEELCVDQASPGRVLVFRGEAGIGKTALLTEARRIARERGCTAWYARGGETVTSVPFNVVRQLLQPALLELMDGEMTTWATGTTSRAPPSVSPNRARHPPTPSTCATASSPPWAGSFAGPGLSCC